MWQESVFIAHVPKVMSSGGTEQHSTDPASVALTSWGKSAQCLCVNWRLLQLLWNWDECKPLGPQAELYCQWKLEQQKPRRVCPCAAACFSYCGFAVCTHKEVSDRRGLPGFSLLIFSTAHCVLLWKCQHDQHTAMSRKAAAEKQGRARRGSNEMLQWHPRCQSSNPICVRILSNLRHTMIKC